jgi:GDP-L-fucose synthase
MKRVYVAGHRGLVGSAIVRAFSGYDLVTRTRAELDLTDARAVSEFFAKEKPEWVILAAAKVGGIHGNKTYPTEFLLENLKIQNNVIEASWRSGVQKFMFLGSSCIFPRECPQPMGEQLLLTGALEPTNEGYALAKIAGIKLCAALNRQYGKDFFAVMPSNLYGPGDNYHPENAHVLPMLLQRFHQAKLAGLSEVEVWGSGKPRREFLHVDDLASACKFLIENFSASEIGEFINIGTGEDCTISELAGLIAETVGYKGQIRFNPSRPDGTMRKLLDVSRLKKLGWSAQIPLAGGVKSVYQDFLAGRVKK